MRNLLNPIGFRRMSLRTTDMRRRTIFLEKQHPTPTDMSSTIDTDEPICGSTDTADGTKCKRPTLDGEQCVYHSDAKETPENVGAPLKNVNAMTTGLYMDRSKLVENLPLSTQVCVWTFFKEWMEQSVYDFAVEQREYDVIEPEDVPEWYPEEHTASDGRLYIQVPVPTENEQYATPLWNLAVGQILMNRINAVLAENNMEKEVSAGSRYVDGEWEQITEKKAHHYNLAYDRLIRQQPKLMELGGVEP